MKPVSRGFQTPPEVTRYFSDKGRQPAFSWLDVWGQEHAYAFTVAKAVDTELLRLFKESIQKAIESGQGFETWRQGLLPELQKLGWLGPRKVDDPSGKWDSKLVDFSRPRRLETIFWSNVRTARAAGQWERIQRTKKGLPFLLYVRTTSAEPRIQHLAWAGVILPVDHAFWSTHFPPNGWHCKCAVRQITRYEYEQLKGKEGYSLDPPTIETKPFLNRRTGEIVHVPVGIDPGWGTNPGLSRAKTLVENVAKQLEVAGETAARARINDILSSPSTEVLLGLEERFSIPVAISGRSSETLGARSPIIWASNDVIRLKTGKDKVPITFEDFKRLQEFIDDAEMIDEGQAGKRSFFIENAARLLKIVVQMSERKIMRIASIHIFSRAKLEKVRARSAAGRTSNTP
ncbi:phage minor head protein [Methylosinus sp. Sm6]|uniref:phage head morphogenesis protein n=1 Tax=Methylosinus sp. Sm6 TaxID=2866948 RepID=UPI001C99F021|nr:phage minor head protein [Methylosinus sp. Sm6]MBY6243988.1 hypothetical protein [Methylosinus sp. Sm6]